MTYWGNLISALIRPLAVRLFTSPRKEGVGDRLQDEHKNSRLQCGLDMGTKETVFLTKVKAENVYKFQILTMLLMQYSRFNFTKIKLLSKDITKVLLQIVKLTIASKLRGPSLHWCSPLQHFTKRKIWCELQSFAINIQASQHSKDTDCFHRLKLQYGGGLVSPRST